MFFIISNIPPVASHKEKPDSNKLHWPNIQKKRTLKVYSLTFGVRSTQGLLPYLTKKNV